MNNSSIAAALRDANSAIVQYFGSIPVATFFEGSAEAWSPGHHLQHLAQSNSPVAMALARPDVATVSASAASRSYDEVVAVYREALASGAARATGRFAPSLDGVERSRQGQKEVVERFRAAGAAVVEAMASWEEDRMDKLSLRHPALGPLTVREMLYFTLYHNQHHRRRVEALLGR